MTITKSPTRSMLGMACIIFLLAIILGSAFGSGIAYSRPAQVSLPSSFVEAPLDSPYPQQASAPLEKMLDSDGALNVKSGYNGALDPSGWQMQIGPGGEPRFSRTNKTSPLHTAQPSAHSGDENWDDRFGPPGVEVLVKAIAVSGNDLYVNASGSAGGVLANGIMKWNGTQWSTLGSGLSGGSAYTGVEAIAVIGSDVYVGGSFTTAGGIPANNIARWDGAQWSSLGSGTNGVVYALAASGTNLYAGGRFVTAGGVTVNHIARWDGAQWSSLGTGMAGGREGTRVLALATTGSDVYAGGDFYSAGGVYSQYLAKWNGSQWSNFGSVDDFVRAIAISGSNLYIGGSFEVAGSVAVYGIARWDGAQWHALGSGVNNWVDTIAVSGSNVYAGGSFYMAGGINALNIARWDGSQWHPMGVGNGADEPVYTIVASPGGDVYAGGSFTAIGNVGADHIAKWNGSEWSILDDGHANGMAGGTITTVYAMAVSGNNVYVGGEFYSAGGVLALNIARWDGSRWYPLGSGMQGPLFPAVYAIAVSGNNVYVGGAFRTAGGVSANHIARWDGSQWHPLGNGITSSSNRPVRSIAVSGTDVYVGGNFYSAGGVSVNNIARWDGSRWHPMGTGFSSCTGSLCEPSVNSIAVSGSTVYAGGNFTTSGSTSVNRIARWDGGQWHPLGSGVSGTSAARVNAITIIGSDLYVGGSFTFAGTVNANHIARWDGGQWHPLGSGVSDPYPVINALAVSARGLYAGGQFTTAGGVSAKGIALWDGSQWSPLGNGLGLTYSHSASTIAILGTDVYVGGYIRVAGNKPSKAIALWHELAVSTPTPTLSATSIATPIATITPTTVSTVTPTACSLTFTDVPNTHTFYANVRCLACRGIISGYVDSTFRPDNLVTRGQLAKIVSNAAAFIEPPGTQIFQDVPTDHTFYEWINRLTNRGYMSGYTCGNLGEPCINNRPYFRPFNNATRAQTSKIVSNAARYNDPPTGQTFEDVPPTHPFYTEIQRLASRNIMGGYQCGGPGEPCILPLNRPYFRPYNDVTRGQSAKIIANTFYPNCPTSQFLYVQERE